MINDPYFFLLFLGTLAIGYASGIVSMKYLLHNKEADKPDTVKKPTLSVQSVDSNNCNDSKRETLRDCLLEAKRWFDAFEPNAADRDLKEYVEQYTDTIKKILSEHLGRPADIDDYKQLRYERAPMAYFFGDCDVLYNGVPIAAIRTQFNSMGGCHGYVTSIEKIKPQDQ